HLILGNSYPETLQEPWRSRVEGERAETYHGPLESILIQLEPPQRLRHVVRALNDVRDVLLPGVLEDRLHLALRGGLLLDGELERVPHGDCGGVRGLIGGLGGADGGL